MRLKLRLFPSYPKNQWRHGYSCKAKSFMDSSMMENMVLLPPLPSLVSVYRWCVAQFGFLGQSFNYCQWLCHLLLGDHCLFFLLKQALVFFCEFFPSFAHIQYRIHCIISQLTKSFLLFQRKKKTGGCILASLI